MKQLLLGQTGGSATQLLTNLSEEQLKEIIQVIYETETPYSVPKRKSVWYTFVDSKSKESIHVYLPSITTWMLRDPPQQRKVAGAILVPPSNLRK